MNNPNKNLICNHRSMKHGIVKDVRNGFTIVELLIVIVVIGILTTITIVSYSSFKTRSENTKTVSSVQAYSDAIMVLANDTAGYPAFAKVCLGPSGTICGNITDTTNTICFSGERVSFSDPFVTAIKNVSATIPSPSSQSSDCGGKKYSGAWYYSAGGDNAQILYYLKGNQTCSAVSGLKITSTSKADDTTVCNMSFPTL